MSAFLELLDLGQRFTANNSTLTPFEHVNLELAQGEFLCILGASGCGKTTLLRNVGGFERPTSGQVIVDGQAVTKPGLHCATVFQTFDQLLPWKTVLGNVMFPLLASKKCRSRKEARARAVAQLELVGLTEFVDYYPHQLSGGMKQRVAIARALCMEPRMMLMDEPFASLDADTRTALQKELVRLWALSGITILFVTHSIMESIALSTKLMVMGNGGVQMLLDNPVQGERGKLRTPESQGYAECWAMLNGAVRKQA